jgi:predicted DNA binding CopG/RHH family protein
MTPDRSASSRIEEAQDILQTMRHCRARLNRINFDHAASHADIAVQLTKQAIAAEKRTAAANGGSDCESSPANDPIPHDQS